MTIQAHRVIWGSQSAQQAVLTTLKGLLLFTLSFGVMHAILSGPAATPDVEVSFVAQWNATIAYGDPDSNTGEVQLCWAWSMYEHHMVDREERLCIRTSRSRSLVVLKPVVIVADVHLRIVGIHGTCSDVYQYTREFRNTLYAQFMEQVKPNTYEPVWLPWNDRNALNLDLQLMANLGWKIYWPQLWITGTQYIYKHQESIRHISGMTNIHTVHGIVNQWATCHAVRDLSKRRSIPLLNKPLLCYWRAHVFHCLGHDGWEALRDRQLGEHMSIAQKVHEIYEFKRKQPTVKNEGEAQLMIWEKREKSTGWS